MKPEQTLYWNGPVLTMDDAAPSAEAVLTEGERILKVGPLSALRREAGRQAVEVDLRGHCLMPAFIDPHGHFPDPGFVSLFRVDLSAPPRGDCTDMAMALGRLRQKVRQTPKGEWVMGVLFDNTSVAERRMPSRAELDSVSADHPVWVLHASGHNGVANSVALRMRGISRDTPDPVGGRFGRDPDSGALTGLIEGLSAMGPMGDTDFLITRSRFWQGVEACREEYLAQGVTCAQNAWASAQDAGAFRQPAARPGSGPGSGPAAHCRAGAAAVRRRKHRHLARQSLYPPRAGASCSPMAPFSFRPPI